MAQAGYTPIQLYYSTTTTNAPSAGNLTDGELAINTADGKLFYKDNLGAVQVIGWKTVPVSAGGTGITSGTSGGIPYYSSTSAIASSAALAANSLVIGGGAGVAPSTTTTGTGVLTAVGSAVNTSGGLVTQSGTLTSSALLLGGGSGTAISSTTTGTGVVTALGVNVGSSGAFTTNNAANTFTALQTFSGSTSVLAAALTNAAEVATISATAATGTINYDVTTQSVLYYTSNASANWTVNFRASSGTSLNTAMSTGQSVTVAFLVTQGATAYYNNVVQVDGNAVTPKYQGGTAWSAGNASGIDAYVYTIIKTGSAAFTVLASQTQFK